MAGRRNTTPLFEIVSRNGSGPAAPPERPSAPAPPPARTPPSERDALTRPAAGSADYRGPGRALPPPSDGADLDADVAGRDAESAADAHEHDTTESPSAPRTKAVDADSIEEPARAARPLPGIAHRGLSIPASTGGVERDMPRTMGRISVAGGTVRLPVNYVYVGLTIALVLALATWTLGYMFGGRNADEKARREIESATGASDLRDPLDQGASGTTRVPTGGNQPGDGAGGALPRSGSPITSAPGPGGEVVAGLPAIGSGRTAFLGPGGFFEREPRQAGLNYLCLVSRLPEADAVKAIDFLARQGVVAMGLEHARSAANNRLFDLYTLEGLTRTEFAREGGSTRRDTHEALLAELGRRWRTEERGTSDFGRPQWYRFNP